MEIREKYLSPECSSDGDIITFLDGGEYVKMGEGAQARDVINFRVHNGRYEQIYTPGAAAQKILIKAFTRQTDNWIGKKFSVKIVDNISFGKVAKIILPQPLDV